MDPTTDLLVFWLVILGRFLLPLLIPVFPLPAMIACLILDGLDKGIFTRFTNLPLDNYQSYDKALDIYYLTIAFVATMRNWVNLDAYKVSRFLFYYRMIGSALFELTQLRFLLFIFPNTFEYFFDFYEAVRMRWNPKRMALPLLIGVAAFIWICIKLPQEWWIHIAQLDMTDFLLAHPPLLVSLVILALLSPFIRKWVLTKLPNADHPLQLKAVPEIKKLPLLHWRDGLVEKLVLVTIISIIFAQMLPGLSASTLQLAVGIVIVIAVNSFVVNWIKLKRNSQFSTPVNFGLTITLNLLMGAIYAGLRWGAINVEALLFFSLLLGVIVAFFDSYQPYYRVRVSKET